MMNLNQAIAYGKRIGVRFYVLNDNDCIMGGTQTLEQAEAMKKRFEIEDASLTMARRYRAETPAQGVAGNRFQIERRYFHAQDHFCPKAL